jgi:SagB-type dehydrogenase family enzyme
LVRSPNVVAYWRGGRFLLEEFVQGRTIEAAPAAVDILGLFGQPRTVRSAAAGLSSYTHRSVEREVGRLAKLGFLIRPRDRPARRDAASCWSGSIAAAYFHFSTANLTYLTDPTERIRFCRRRLADEAQPALYKAYRGLERIGLPANGARSPIEEVLRARRTVRGFSRAPVPLAAFAALIRGTWGQTGWTDGGPLGRLIAKTSPSAGSRHPIECYVAAWNVRGLDRGLYHYSVRDDSLECLRRGDFRSAAVRFAGGQSWVRRAAFLCIMTVMARRVFWKYSSSDAYRLFLLDAGHLAQTFAVLATAEGLGPFTTAALSERAIERHLRIDGLREFPIYLCGAGMPAAAGRRVAVDPALSV